MPYDVMNSPVPVFTDKTIVFVKMNEDAILPAYSKLGDAGMDIYSYEDAFLSYGDRKVIHTSVKIKIPEGTVGFVCPRSGLAAKSGITVANAPGVVDSGFSGELCVILQNHDIHGYQVMKGDRIAQLVIIPYVRCEIVEKQEITINTERGEDGFGSTGV
jgi:dUTP pyrophosphatase